MNATVKSNAQVQRAFVWGSVLAFGLPFVVGVIVLGKYIPPPSPAASGASIRHWYLGHLTGIRVGMVIDLFGMVGFLVFAMALVTQLRRIECCHPLVDRTLVAAVAGIFTLAEMILLVWAVASYRPGSISPDITRMLNDFGWVLFLIAYPPFCYVLCVAGWLILTDRKVVFPRWYGYLNLWVALGEMPVMLMLFTKHGAFSYRGLITLYVPIVVLGVWTVGTLWALLHAIAIEELEAEQQPARPTVGSGAATPAVAIRSGSA